MPYTSYTGAGMPQRLRLKELRPERAALYAAERLMNKAAAAATGLGLGVQAPHGAEGTPVYREALLAARYAVGDLPGSDVEQEASYCVSRLHAWFTSEELNQPEPETLLALVVAGVVARSRLDRGESLSVPELSILTGIDRSALTRQAAAGKIPSAYRSKESRHNPWRFRVTLKFRAWLAHYMTPATEALTDAHAP